MPSIRHKITALSILLVMTTAGAIILLFHWNTGKILERNTLRKLGQETQLRAHELEQRIRRFEDDIRLFAALLPIAASAETKGTWGREPLSLMLTEELRARPAYLRIRFIRTGGPPLELARAERFPDLNSDDLEADRYTDRTLIEKAAALSKGEVNLSRIAQVPTGNRTIPMLTAVTPVSRADSTLSGALVAETRFADGLNREDTEYFLLGHTLYITDEEGRYLVRSHPNDDGAATPHRVQEEFPQAGDLLQPGNPTDAQTFLHTGENGRQLVAFRRISLGSENKGRSILLGISADYALLTQAQQQPTALSTLVPILLVVAGGLLAYRWSRSVVRPLREATGIVETGKSRQSVESSVQTKEDEAAILAHSFREALKQLDEKEEELRALNTELETKVVDRTRALSEELAERMRVEADLNRFKTTLDLTLDCVFMFELDTLKFFYVNRGAMEQVGYTHEELMRLYPYDIKPHFDEASFKALIAPMLEGQQKAATFETTHRHKDGTDIPVEIFLQYIDPPGESPRFVAIVRDITERKRTEDALRLSQRQLETAQRIAHVGHWDWNIETGALYWSDEIYRLFGLMPQEFDATYAAFLERIHPDDRAAVITAVNEAVDDSKPYAIEHRIVRPDGNEVFVYEVGEVTRSKDGTPLRMVGTVQDITERKKIDRMKDEFIATVSHELRTPLTSIRGSLGLLTGGAMGETSERMRSLLEIANNNTERLLLLINDILDISKIESGKMELHPRSVSVGIFLEQAIAANQAYANAHKVQFRNATPGVDACIYADNNRLMQVMNNIMANAAKFAPPGSEVQVRAVYTGEFARISVTDRGPGIPEEFQARVFDKFTQADASDTRQVGGTGLGLNIAKAIVEAHGGRIGFVTAKDFGTTFYFDLPVWSGGGHSIPPFQKSTLAEETILICDGDPDAAASVGAMLTQSGYGTEIAHDATQARQLLAGRRYRAMILEPALPGEDGLALLKDLREQERTRSLPVIVVSAATDEARTAVDGNVPGIIDWISKPVDSQRLLTAVTQVPERRNKFRPRILYVEDDPDLRQIVATMFGEKAEVAAAPTLEEAHRQLLQDPFDLLLLDMDLPDGCGLELLNHRDPLPPVVIFSAQEVNCHRSHNVAASLVKSRTSNEALVETITALIESPHDDSPPGPAAASPEKDFEHDN